MMVDNENNAFRIGDHITLRCPKHGVYMSSEGILLEDFGASKDPFSFEDHVFQIFIQRQYSATNEVEDFLDFFEGDVSRIQDASVRKHYDALARGKHNEEKMNERFMKLKTGNYVLFGEIIQLFHVKSKKFVTAFPETAARDERENMIVRLDPDGSTRSWFQVLPRYKIDREGDRIRNNVEVLLKVAESGGEYLRCADKHPSKGRLREVNSSSDAATPWKLSIYQKCNERNEKSLLLAGELVYIRDPETQSMLMPIRKPLNVKVSKGRKFKTEDDNSYISLASHSVSMAPSIVTSHVHRRHDDDDDNDNDGQEDYDMDDDDGNDDDDEDSQDSIEEYIEEHGEVVFVASGDEENIDSNAVWVLEFKMTSVGGVVDLRDSAQLRHLNTGKYLVSVNTDGNKQEKCQFNLERSPMRNNLFNVVEIYPTSSKLCNSKPVQIKQLPFLMERGSFHARLQVWICGGTRSKHKATSLIINRYIDKSEIDAQKHNTTAGAGGAGAGDDKVVKDIFVGKSTKWHLSKYFSAMHIPDPDSVTMTIWRKGYANLKLFFNILLGKVKLFVQGYPILFDSSMTDFVTSKITIIRRQNQFRQQGILEILLKMLNYLTPLAERYRTREARVEQFEVGGLMFMAQEVIGELLSLLFELIKGNPENQMYIADYLLIILSHVPIDPNAAKIAQEMLSGNRELQETKVSFKEICLFAEEMKSSPMNAMYLNLLRSCCSSAGLGVPKNQSTVYDVIYVNNPNLLLYITNDFKFGGSLASKSSGFNMASNSTDVLMHPSEKIDQQQQQQNLFLYWKSLEDPKYSVEQIFGKNCVGLLDVFKSLPAGGPLKIKVSPHGTVTGLKKCVAEYFVAQLLLASELCLGRNYTIIEKLEPFYSFEQLLSILKMPIHELLKSSAASLICSMYLDRDPQNTTSLPRLTRTWTDVTKSSMVALVSADTSNVSHNFESLQNVIVDHIKNLKGKSFNVYTHSYMQLLQKLVLFSFFGTCEKLTVVIDGLLGALKRDENDNDFTSNTSENEMVRVESVRRRSSMSKRRSGARNSISMSNSFSTTKHASDDISMLQDIPEQNSPRFGELLMSYLESKKYICVMLLVLLLSVAVSTYVYLTDKYDLPMYYFDVAVFILFAVDIFIRTILFPLAGKSIKTYIFEIPNILDVAAVVIDWFMFFGYFSRTFRFFRILRAARFLNLLYVLRATRMLSNISKMTMKSSAWTESKRYRKTTWLTLLTMTDMVGVLSTIQRSIEDRNISLMLYAYYTWHENRKAPKVTEPVSNESMLEIFNEVIQESKGFSIISNQENDDILIDLLMYEDNPLIQKTLDVLVTHHSSQRTLIDNFSNLQLLVNGRRESQFSRLETIVRQLTRHIDLHDLWGKLKDDEPDHKKINTQVFQFLKDLMESCRKRRHVLKFDEDFEADRPVQDVLRNLGCIDLCIKIFHLIHSINKESITVSHKNTKNLIAHGSELLYWLIIDNSPSQAFTFQYFDFFIKTIDEKISSHKIIYAILNNNEKLIKSVPKQYFGDFINRICAGDGQLPEYLALLKVATVAGEKSIFANQYEVVRLISAPGNQKKVLLYFTPKSHPSYTKKIKGMNGLLNKKDVGMDDISSDLAYHLELLNVLSNCSNGTVNMTTIEAKIQSMFFFVDVFEAIMDPHCLLLAKVRLGLFCFNAIMDLEMRLPSLKDAAIIWTFLEHTLEIFEFGRDDFRQIEKNGWEHATSSRQKVEYLIVCAKIIGGYFDLYFDNSIFRPEVGHGTFGVERVHIKEVKANEIMGALFSKINGIYEMRSPLLAKDHQTTLYKALVALNDKATVHKFVSQVENLHDSVENFKDSKKDNSETSTKVAHAPTNRTENKKFNEFIDALLSNEQITKLCDDQIQDFITKLEKLPKSTDNVTSDVRFDALIKHLIRHVRSTIKTNVHGDEVTKSMLSNEVRSAIWILKVFRTMIENRWGMTIHQRDDDGGEEQDKASGEIVHILNRSGASKMCLDMLARGIDLQVQEEAINLLVAMLFHEGGALSVQTSIYQHLNKPGSDLFFQHIKSLINNMIGWHKWHGVIVLEAGQEVKLPEGIILIRCLQLMCEGHYSSNQDILRNQPNNTSTINILTDLVDYFQALDVYKCRTSTEAALSVAALILEVIQGPCEGNQEYFTLETELIETLNRKMRHRPENDCDPDQEISLKKTVIDILQGLMEGQGKKTQIYEKILSVIHIDVLHLLSNPVLTEVELSPEAFELKTESSVVMKMLTDYKPSLREEVGISQNISDSLGKSVACIEIIWRGELQRKFFHVPDICLDLAVSTKEHFIATVDRSSAENKLYGLVSAAGDMYKEILHQQRLKEFGLARIFNRTNQVRSAWMVFVLALLVNLLFMSFYYAKKIPCSSSPSDLLQSAMPLVSEMPSFSPTPMPMLQSQAPTSIPTPAPTAIEVAAQVCTEIVLQDDAVSAVFGVTIVLIFFAFYTLLLYMVVRVPVNFLIHRESNKGLIKPILLTAFDPTTVYYAGYLLLSILGLFHHVILSVLLLDIISKSPAAQDVLNAVYKPKNVIFMTMVLNLIILYIYAVFAFFKYDNSENFSDGVFGAIYTLRDVFKDFLRYGSPYGAQGDLILTLVDWRFISDVLFFLVMFTMWNIIKGITIDTFVELRADKESRIEDTEERCFICGIEKNVFNRTLDRNAFENHISSDQNLWNFIYFIIYVWEQDKDDDDGLESFVRKCITEGDLSWFPMNKALRMMEHENAGHSENLLRFFQEDMSDMQAGLNLKLLNFKETIGRSVTRVEQVITMEQEVEYQPTRRLRHTSTLGSVVGGNPGTFVDARGFAFLGVDNSINDKAGVYCSIFLNIHKISGLVISEDLVNTISCRVTSSRGSEVFYPSHVEYDDPACEDDDASDISGDNDSERPVDAVDRASLLFDSSAPHILIFEGARPVATNATIRMQIVSYQAQSERDWEETDKDSLYEQDIALHIGTAFISLQSLFLAADDSGSLTFEFCCPSLLSPNINDNCQITLNVRKT